MDNLTGLLGQIAGKSEGALAEFYDRTSRVVYGLALRIVRDRRVAEDVTLDVYMDAWRKAEAFREEASTAMSWIILIARNRALDKLREARAVAGCEDGAYDSDTLRVSHPVSQFLAGLPADQRMAIDLALFSGFTHSEIAKRTGMSTRTTQAKIHDVMMQFRNQSGCFVEPPAGSSNRSGLS